MAGLVGAAEGQSLPTVSPAEYGQWERLGAFEMDPTGRWLVSAITRIDGDRELRLARADDGSDRVVMPYGRSPDFSRDGRWMAYRKGVSAEAAEATEGPPAPDRLGLVDLTSGADSVHFAISGFTFRDDGRWLAALGVPSADSVGGDLVVMDPATGARTVIGNVADYAWQDDGPLLAATLKTAWGGGNGVVVFDPDANRLSTLTSADADFTSLTWRDDSSTLAVLRSVPSGDDDADDDDVTHDVLVWTDGGASAVSILSGEGREAGGGRVRITEYDGIDFSDDGRTLFVGVRPWDADPHSDEGDHDGDDDDGAPEGDEGADNSPAGDTENEAEDEVGPADVQVWHWNDDQIIRAQEYRAGAISRQTLAAAWHLDGDRFVVLGTDLDEPVRVVAGGRWGIVPDYDPYLFERRFGAGSADWYRVDVSTGERVLVAERLEFGLSSTEEESRVLEYTNDAWAAVDLATLGRTPIGSGRSFTRSLEDYDYPGPRPSWGVGGWIPDADAVLLYDAHDVWRADLRTGGLTRVTDGAAENQVYRLVNLDPDQSPFGAGVYGEDDALWFSHFDRRTKASGYARLDGGGVRSLVTRDARVTGLSKARGVDRYALKIERWDDSPDVFTAGGDLSDLVRVTDTNPFQADFAWGHSELLDYTTDAGHDLQAILVYPAGFEEGRRYPLILYQYERLSDGLHTYDAPNERDYYNYQSWSQAGYFVLMPDILYEPGRPGPSALDAVEHALDAAVATGHVDPEGMGLIGHSWGGYQAAYLPTRTDRFAASVAGAAITNFMSFMGAVHWNGGLPETGHWETGQARMAAPYWEDVEGHLESSPANFIMDLETPMMLMHGDADGVVDFYQGLEFYNYARRAGKEVVLLVYPGADHGLSDESQQVDYHRRIHEWFGHYLKGEPAPSWITDGETWVERDRRLGG